MFTETLSHPPHLKSLLSTLTHMAGARLILKQHLVVSYKSLLQSTTLALVQGQNPLLPETTTVFAPQVNVIPH